MLNHGDDHYATLIESQRFPDKRKYINKISPFLPTRSTVSVQRKDNSPLPHGMVIEHGSEHGLSRSFKTRVQRYDIL